MPKKKVATAKEPVDRAVTPQQKTGVIQILLNAWLDNPKLRLGQLVGNLAGARNVFLIEDYELARAARMFSTVQVICGSKSPGDVDDYENRPVTCSRVPGHKGDHAGGTQCGTVEWRRR